MTIRYRDTLQQERVNVSQVRAFLADKMGAQPLFWVESSMRQGSFQHRLKSLLRRGRRKFHRNERKQYRVARYRLCAPSLFLGTEYGGWSVIPELMPPKPCVFSVGIGQDISFDLEMIRRFNATVFGFDPTPKSRQWIQERELPRQFHFVPIGLADYDGTADFGLNRPDWESYSVLLPIAESVERAQCRVARRVFLAGEVDVCSTLMP